MGDLMRCGLGKLQQEILANLDEARGWLIRKLNDYGNVEKSHQRRSLPSPKRFAQAGRLFAVLTY
jgi:hypothetical protein